MPRAPTTTTLRLVFSLYFPLSLPLSLPAVSSSRTISPYLCLLPRVLSPSFAAVTIFLPGTRGIIRTGSLLAWRFVGELCVLSLSLSFSLARSAARAPFPPFSSSRARSSKLRRRRGVGKERKTAVQKERRKDKTKYRVDARGKDGERAREGRGAEEMVPSFG